MAEDKSSMEKNDIQRFIFESMNARQERTVRMLIVTILICIALLVVTNLAWLYTWNQYDFSSEEVTVESEDEGNANYLGAGARGVINNERKNHGEAENGN